MVLPPALLHPGALGRADRASSYEVLTCWEASMPMRSSFSKTGSLSGDDASAGITTTGLTCSDRAEARRKLGGFWRGKTHFSSPARLPASRTGPPGSAVPWHAYLWQLRDLNEPLKVLQVAGAVEEIFQPRGGARSEGCWGPSVAPGRGHPAFLLPAQPQGTGCQGDGLHGAIMTLPGDTMYCQPSLIWG